LATLVNLPPRGDEWLHEIKLDGYRTGARIERGKVRLFTRHGLDWTARYGPIPATLASLPVKAAYLDGEIAVLTAEGISDFGALQEALGHHGGSREMAFIVFDMVHPSHSATSSAASATAPPMACRRQAAHCLPGRLCCGNALLTEA
jgi:bifunctional non-homologous end joining protein LigD